MREPLGEILFAYDLWPLAPPPAVGSLRHPSSGRFCLWVHKLHPREQGWFVLNVRTVKGFVILNNENTYDKMWGEIVVEDPPGPCVYLQGSGVQPSNSKIGMVVLLSSQDNVYLFV